MNETVNLVSANLSTSQPSVLVVGATGQLGGRATQLLVAAGHRVRALIRPGAQYQHLRNIPGLEFVEGDLRDYASLEKACEGISAVVATATVVFPRGKYSFAQDEGIGYENLVRAAKTSGVNHILFVSIAAPYLARYTDRVPTLRMKQFVEAIIVGSGLGYTILRSAPFMDDYFALIGSDIPLCGSPAATLLRPFWMSRVYTRITAKLIERWGVASVPGRIARCHSFIALDDVAHFIRAAVARGPLNRTLVIGGARAYSWNEIAQLYGRLLGRVVRALPTVPFALRTSMELLRPLSSAASNQLGVLWVLSENDIVVDPNEALAEFNVSLTSPEIYLAEKIAARGRPDQSSSSQSTNT